MWDFGPLFGGNRRQPPPKGDTPRGALEICSEVCIFAYGSLWEGAHGLEYCLSEMLSWFAGLMLRSFFDENRWTASFCSPASLIPNGLGPVRATGAEFRKACSAEKWTKRSP